jgi:hypothetical protein
MVADAFASVKSSRETAMKYLKWIVLGVVAVVLIGLVVVYVNLNSIVRKTVQSQATASLNLQTTVGGASVNLFSGNVGLSDVKVDSPQGFDAPDMFTLGGTKVDVTYGELRKEPVRVDEIVIDRPRLVVEQKGGKFNFKVLMDQQSQQPSEGEPMKLVIDKLAVNGAQVALRPGIPGLSNEINVTIPSFTVEKIGTGEGAQNGAAIKEVVMLLVTTMASKAAESDQLPPEVQLLLKGDLQSVAKEMAAKYGGQAIEELKKNLPPEVGGAVGNVLDAAKSGEDPGKAVEEGLRGLIDKKKDKPATQPK